MYDFCDFGQELKLVNDDIMFMTWKFHGSDMIEVLGNPI